MQCTLGRVEYVTPHRVCSIRRDREAQWRGLRIPRGYWGKRIVVARWSQFLRPDRREGWISRVTTHEFPCAPRTLTSQSSGRTVDSPSLGLASDETEGESVIHRVKTSNAGTLTPDPHDRASAHGKKNPCAAAPVRPSVSRAERAPGPYDDGSSRTFVHRGRDRRSISRYRLHHHQVGLPGRGKKETEP
jgi:hypothetical protein